LKDYVLQIKIKNGPLMRLMRGRGYYTAPALARASGVTITTIYNCLNLKEVPVRKDGSWKEPVWRLSKFFRVIPELMFPPQHIEKALPNNSIEAEVSLDEIKSLPGVAGAYLLEEAEEEEAEERDNLLTKYLGTISGREKNVLEMRFGLNGKKPTGLEATGKYFAVSRERIRQIEMKALRRMRHRFGWGPKNEHEL